MKLKFDPSINAGHIGLLTVQLVAIIWFAADVKSEVKINSEATKANTADIKEITKAQTETSKNLAVVSKIVDNLEKRRMME